MTSRTMRCHTLRQFLLLVTVLGLPLHACSSDGGAKVPDSGAPAASGGTSYTLSSGGIGGTGGQTGGIVGTGGEVATGGVPSTGGIAAAGGVAGGTIQDASAPGDCSCTYANLRWEMSWDCFCTIRDCSVSLSTYLAGSTFHLDGSALDIQWYVDEFADCGLVHTSEESDRGYTEKIFDLASERLLGQKEELEGGLECPFGGDAGRKVYSLWAGQTKVPSDCKRTKCAQSRSISHCGSGGA